MALTISGGKVVIGNVVAGDSVTVNTTILSSATSIPRPLALTPPRSTPVMAPAPGYATLTTTINTLSATSLSLNTNDLSTASDAQTALTAITSAINTVAAQRGSIGASINQLTSDTNVENTQVQNLTSAQNGVQNANIASTTANLAQENILEQTGFAAIQQTQSAEQNVLKLLQ